MSDQISHLTAGAGARQPFQKEGLQSEVYIELDCGATNLWIDNFYPDFTKTINMLAELGVKTEELFTDHYGKYALWAEG